MSFCKFAILLSVSLPGFEISAHGHFWILIYLVFWTGEADSCPNMCIQVYSPVCGSDNVTYNNLCELQIASCQGTTKSANVVHYLILLLVFQFHIVTWACCPVCLRDRIRDDKHTIYLLTTFRNFSGKTLRKIQKCH